jgi:hypothetical protein
MHLSGTDAALEFPSEVSKAPELVPPPPMSNHPLSLFSFLIDSINKIEYSRQGMGMAVYICIYG